MRNQIENFLHTAIPGAQISDLHRIPGGVSGAAVYNARLTQPFQGRVVAKYASGIGALERAGGRLIQPYIAIPQETGRPLDDCYIMHHLPGENVNSLVIREAPEAERALQTFVEAHSDMWHKTISRTAPSTGYTRKAAETATKLAVYTLGGHSMTGLMKRRVLINGKLLPPMEQILSDINARLNSLSLSILSHGDEGWANGIYDNDRVYMVDHCTAGRRVLPEAIAKIALWIPVTQGKGDFFESDVRGDEFEISYQLRLPNFSQHMMRQAFIAAMSNLSHLYTRESLYAAMALYVFREIQWTARRGRECILGYLIGLALELSGGMYGYEAPFGLEV